MNKLIVCGLFLAVSGLKAEGLEVSMKASPWSFKDADKKEFTMDAWKGKVLVVNYVDPDEKDLNEHFNDALKKAVDDGLLSKQTYRGMGIVDCAATWKPNFAIRLIAAKKAKKFKTTILFDYDASLRKAWGLKKDSANVIILDKDRVCRAIIRGRVPEVQVEPLIKLVAELQSQ